MKEPGLYPGRFIPIAERNGWIWRIGRITTELAVKQLSDMIQGYYFSRPIPPDEAIRLKAL